MKKQKEHFRLTLAISILIGMILPLAMGVRDLYSMALILALIWFVDALIRFITVFLIQPNLKIKGSRRNGVTVVKLELIRKDSE